ncbi:MAG: NAD(P)H-dependent oxidoreductase [Pseudolabrys sp.]|nr:NAD(P)H-dependent oxidoreductase [Pseudolabrys sp.]MSP31575.1 NAD(P)H-dependent oxidoreductase [Pseudolabrys sp.]
MADKLNVLVICGSLRKGSFNASVGRALPALAPPELALTPAPSFANFPLYNADTHAASGAPADVEAWAGAIRAADGVIIVSPEYNWSIPGGLKNAIDWMSRLKDIPFKDKPIALQSASGGQVGGARMQYHLRMTLTAIDAQMFGKPEVFVNFAAKKVDEKTGELTDEPVKDIIKQQLAAFAKFIKRVKV